MNKNWEIYKEYLNSCIVRNESVKNTTYRTYTNSMKQFIEQKKFQKHGGYFRTIHKILQGSKKKQYKDYQQNNSNK